MVISRNRLITIRHLCEKAPKKSTIPSIICPFSFFMFRQVKNQFKAVANTFISGKKYWYIRFQLLPQQKIIILHIRQINIAKFVDKNKRISLWNPVNGKTTLTVGPNQYLNYYNLLLVVKFQVWLNYLLKCFVI